MLGTAIWITKENKQHKKVWDSSTPGPKGYNLHVMISPPSREKQKNWVDIKTKSQVKIKGYLYQLWKQKFQETVPSFVCKSYHSQMLRCYLKLSLRQPEQKKKKKQGHMPGQVFPYCISKSENLMKGSDCNSHWVSFLKVQHERFYPCPHSCQCNEVQILQHLLCAAKTSPAQAGSTPCPLGAAPGAASGAAGQGSHISCSYQSTTSSLMLPTSGNSNRAHQTDQSVSGENGLLSSQITQIQGILQLFGFWAHIPELLVPLMMWSLPGETSAVFHLMVYLSSTSLHHTQQGLFHLCPLLSTSPAREHNQRPAWGRNTREHWEKPQKPW